MEPFASILEYIDQIEVLLGQRKSPKAIATELGIPEKWMTIYRYKKQHFDLQKAGAEAWTEERRKTKDERLAAGKAEIVNTLELINLAKLRAKQLLSPNLGDTYDIADGTSRKLSLGVASIYWPIGQKMLCELSKREDEIASDDPESRKAPLEELGESELRAIVVTLDATEKKGSSHSDV